jgi:hypothetical protein
MATSGSAEHDSLEAWGISNTVLHAMEADVRDTYKKPVWFVYDPKRVDFVESAVGHAQSTALKGRTFQTIDAQNAHLLHWNQRWAFTGIHGTMKRQVREMFAKERSALGVLPATRFEYFGDVERRVHFDGRIEADGAYYWVPPRYAGTKFIVHISRLSGRQAVGPPV